MTEETATQAGVSIPTSPEAEPEGGSTQMMVISHELVVMTWIAFIIVAFALHKLLWKPLLRALEKRETDIRDALAGADRARDEVAECDQRKQGILHEATKTAREKVDQAAREAAVIKDEAGREAHEVAAKRMKEAEEQIALEKAKAEAAIRTATITQIGGLLEKVLSQELSSDQKRHYQEAMLREVEL